MPSHIKRIALSIVALSAAACSIAPATSTSHSETPAVGNAAPQPSAPQTLAAAASAPVASNTAPAGAVDASLVKAGYSVMRRHDEVFYCRNEIITGQRIGTRVCLTAAQIQSEKQNVNKAKDLLNQPSYQCLGLSCNN
jgi:hypothetical protein